MTLSQYSNRVEIAQRGGKDCDFQRIIFCKILRVWIMKIFYTSARMHTVISRVSHALNPSSRVATRTHISISTMWFSTAPRDYSFRCQSVGPDCPFNYLESWVETERRLVTFRYVNNALQMHHHLQQMHQEIFAVRCSLRDDFIQALN